MIKKTRKRKYILNILQRKLIIKNIQLKKNNTATVSTITKNGKKINFDCEAVLISVGRKPNTKNLNLETIGVLLDDKNKEIIIETDKTIISTGSEPVSLPGIKFDEKVIISSTGALSLGAVPKKMVVVGGGYIGLEMGSVWSRLGAEVHVVEFLDHITPGMDEEISKEFMQILQKQGINFHLETKVDSIKKKQYCNSFNYN